MFWLFQALEESLKLLVSTSRKTIENLWIRKLILASYMAQATERKFWTENMLKKIPTMEPEFMLSIQQLLY